MVTVRRCSGLFMATQDKPTHHTLDDREIYDARAASKYCGFKTPSGLRRARLRGQVTPCGRRGRGTWLYERAELDRFLGRGDNVAEERTGTPSRGSADNAREVFPRLQHVASGNQTSRDLQDEERRLSSPDPSDGSVQSERKGSPARTAADDDRAGVDLAGPGEGAAVAP